MQVRLSWEQTIERLEALFEELGVSAVRSFDLQLARQGLRDPSSCPCPHHGTERCTCQYLVYLLYSDDPDPISVVVHGHGGRTQISIEQGAGDFGQNLRERVCHRLLAPKLRA